MNIPGWDNLGPEEQAVVRWQYRLCGDFETALWHAITKADDDNLELLRRGFPIHVTGFLRYNRTPGWWPNVVKRAGGDVEAGY